MLEMSTTKEISISTIDLKNSILEEKKIRISGNLRIKLRLLFVITITIARVSFFLSWSVFFCFVLFILFINSNPDTFVLLLSLISPSSLLLFSAKSFRKICKRNNSTHLKGFRADQVETKKKKVPPANHRKAAYINSFPRCAVFCRSRFFDLFCWRWRIFIKKFWYLFNIV
jgi:hypothetical protein